MLCTNTALPPLIHLVRSQLQPQNIIHKFCVRKKAATEQRHESNVQERKRRTDRDRVAMRMKKRCKWMRDRRIYYGKIEKEKIEIRSFCFILISVLRRGCACYFYFSIQTPCILIVLHWFFSFWYSFIILIKYFLSIPMR